MNRYRCLTVLVAIAALPCLAKAMINPHFTPVHLVQQAALIVSVDLKQGQAKDQYAAIIREVLKGKTELKSLRLDLSKAINPQNADALRDLAAAAKPALFFVGEFAPEQERPGRRTAEKPRSSARLRPMGGIRRRPGRRLGLEPDRRQEPGRLGRRHRHAPPGRGLHPPGRRPRSAGDRRRFLEQRPAENRHAHAAKSGPCGRSTWPATASCCCSSRGDQGDHLLVCDAKSRKFTDITAFRRLQSKSQAFAWGDFHGNGRLDLISFDGKTLSLHAQQADGTFQARTAGSCRGTGKRLHRAGGARLRHQGKVRPAGQHQLLARARLVRCPGQAVALPACGHGSRSEETRRGGALPGGRLRR